MTQKYCPSYWGYSVTDDGHVFTHRRRFGKGKGKGGGVTVDWQFQKELKLSVGSGGYLYASISDNGKQRTIPLHTLLLDAFTGKRLPNTECRHLDGNPLNNKLDNLTYGTKKDNADDRIRCGRHTIGETHGRSVLTEDQVRQIRLAHSEGRTIATLAKWYKCGETTIRDIVQWKKWKHVLI